MKKRNPFSFLVYLAILGIVFFVILSVFRGVGNDVPYSKVVELLRKEQVKSFVISDGKIHMKLHTEYDGETSLVTGISDPELFRQEVGELVQQQYEAGISMTCLRSGKACEGKCGTAGCECPPYTPDFVKLAESYGAKGIRVFKQEDVKAAFEEARKNTKVPTLIEFIIDPEDLVYPMVKPGGTLEELILDC